ncbi:hypothetical protein BGX38DRAFT_320273 [Terfezia claveryi]|nr:hypothetical protein BGX38DRAFT_320273 [Terfezia claveryi]
MLMFYLQTQAIMVPASTVSDSQASPSEIKETDHPATLSIDFSSKVTVETRYTQNTAKNIDDLDDGDVPMDLESPRSPQYHSPEPQQRRVTEADSNLNHESMTALQVSGAPVQSQITAKSFDHSGANNADPVGSEGTEEDVDSPPYSPRLDDELPDSPVADMTSATTVAGAPTQPAPVTPSLLLQQLTLHQDLQVPPLLSPLSPPSPLVIPPVGSPLQTLLSLVPFPCANCGALWPMFVNATRPDGRNYCAHCLYNQQKSPQADNSLPVVREHIPLRPPSKKHRPPSLSKQPRRHFERDGSSSFNKNARLAEKQKASLRSPINLRKPEVIDQPVEKIITAQQLMEERYKKQPGIFPTNSRFPPNKEIEQSSEERPAPITPIKDRSDGKDGPKKKLTVSEYALRKKEKEKGFLKKDLNTSLPQGNIGQQETEDMCNFDISEAVAAPVDDAGKPVPEPVEAASSDALTILAPQSETGIVAPGDTEALRQLEKLSQEIKQWKEKFEEQRRFVSNYVKHNAKIMAKLSSTEEQKLIWEKKAAVLEAEITTHRKKQEQLKEENEELRQQRLQQEDVEIQGHLSAEIEAAAEVQAKVIYQGSQSHAEKNTPEKEDQGFLMKNVYKNLTFDIIDPLRDIAGELFNVPDKPTTIPKPRYSATRKTEVLNFNYTNLRSLHLHREVDRTSGSNVKNNASNSSSSSSSSNSPFTCTGATHSDKSRRSVTSGESSDGKSIPFEEFARIPPNMVPVLKEGVLAFRAGQLNPRTRRLDRSVNCYKVGRDVPGELRGIR